MAKISLFSFDLGPAKNLAMITQEALNSKYGARFVGNVEWGACPQLADCDVLITGLASFHNEDELKLGEIVTENNIPWLVLADTHMAWARPAAKGRVSRAIAIVASTVEIEMAKSFGYGDAFYLGGPPLWKEYADIKPVKIEKGRFDKIILVGGIKDIGITNSLLEQVVRAMGEIGMPWELVFKPHPNEAKTEEESERRREILQSVHLLERAESIDQLMGAVDLSIHTSGATSIISAAYQRLPVLWYEDEMIRRRMIDQTGLPTWFPVEAGACNRANAKTIAAEIRKLLFNHQERTKLKKRQEEVYPALPAELTPERNIMKFIESLL